jgi:hypothetical protein
MWLMTALVCIQQLRGNRSGKLLRNRNIFIKSLGE